LSEVGQEDKLLGEFEENKPRLTEPTMKDGVLIGGQSDPQQI